MADTTKEPQPPHRWRFARVGSFNQVLLQSADDLRQLGELDQKLWATLSCPTTGLEFDQQTLELLDSNGDGRVRAQDLIEAVAWVCHRLKDPADLFSRAAALPLDAIDDSHPEGLTLRTAARHILDFLGEQEAQAITAEHTAESQRILASTRFNGDGVVTPNTAEEPALSAAIEDIIACVGSVPDRSGQDGIDQTLSERFFDAAEAYLVWWEKAHADDGQRLPLGDDTPQAFAALASVQAKIDDFFTRVRLAAFDASAADHLNPAEEDYAALAKATLSAHADSLAEFPIARITRGAELPLVDGLNPRWAAAVQAFRTRVITPLLGERDHLSEAQWQEITAAFEGYCDWAAKSSASPVAPLGPARVRELLHQQTRAALDSLIVEDCKAASLADAVLDVNRLVHYHQHLDTLLQSYVSLQDFYTPGRIAVFQAGTLYLDGRSCDLCIRVQDPNAHGELATLSQTFLVYCRCRRRDGEDEMTIVAAVTNGHARNLMVGRNGIFYDRQDRDWDATVIKVVTHPISVGEAAWLPYRRVGRAIAQWVERFSSERDKAIDDGSLKTISELTAHAQAGTPAKSPFDIARFAGIFAAIGLAIGAIGTALASIFGGLLEMQWWELPIDIAGLMLLISGPSMLLAFLKLHQRNLGPLLDGNGWAVNTRAKINIPFGSTLTRTARLPQGARLALGTAASRASARGPREWARAILLVVGLLALLLAWMYWNPEIPLAKHLQQWRDRLETIQSTQASAATAAEQDAKDGSPAQ
ncbi:hypothetical protein [Thiorhodovibrio frisius]|uniref:EF-hand domain-containing protein n=1 Tax=Thiorhodovibrio frisius TaxID=631362 RepID=H8Z3D9_9GAMM|nr:hypothetical protein [Thiorhodovibrio frisius]EIC21847.1 hypothetical protein Thi970DRAFT_02080 [Thiorhodovibrio frisius]WPL21815.1 hypothetical protein Thiofri_01949 [Thiorhodovibrio frisius]